MSNNKPAIFFDRDGTLIKEVGFIGDQRMIRFFPDTVATLRRLQEKYLLFIFSNQSDIVTAEQVDEVNRKLYKILTPEGICIQHWYVCPHARESNCGYRKPNPAFILKAARDYNIDLRHSFVIGDHPQDLATGDAVGVFGLYVLTGHGIHHLDELPPERLIFHTLSEAGRWILDHPDHKMGLARAIKEGAKAIRRGGIVVFPTETVYGLGADALNPEAVQRIFEIKKRPLHDPLIIHISEQQQLSLLVDRLPEKVQQLIDIFWPGPLTLVLPKSVKVPDIVTAGNQTVAVRMPSNPWAKELICLAGTPIAAPSANLFGRTSPTTAWHVEEQLRGSYDVIIDAGACRVGIESTVVSLVDDVCVILRQGGISREKIEQLMGPVQDYREGSRARKESPGLLSHHYAPVTPLQIVENVRDYSCQSDIGTILFKASTDSFCGPTEVLSKDGNLMEVAVNLYAAIQRLDSMGLKMIVVERVPNVGIGRAINDRLEKASSISDGGRVPRK